MARQTRYLYSRTLVIDQTTYDCLSLLGTFAATTRELIEAGLPMIDWSWPLPASHEIPNHYPRSISLVLSYKCRDHARALAKEHGVTMNHVFRAALRAGLSLGEQ